MPSTLLFVYYQLPSPALPVSILAILTAVVAGTTKIIRVPATSANLGSGFDVHGLALTPAPSFSQGFSSNLLLELHIEDLCREA